MTTVTRDQLQVCRDYATARCRALEAARRYQTTDAVRLLDEARRMFCRADREVRRLLRRIVATLDARRDITDPGMLLIVADIRLPEGATLIVAEFN